MPLRILIPFKSSAGSKKIAKGEYKDDTDEYSFKVARDAVARNKKHSYEAQPFA